MTHHAAAAEHLAGDYFGVLYAAARRRLDRRRPSGDPFAAAGGARGRRVRLLAFRRALDPARRYDSRRGAFSDEGAERVAARGENSPFSMASACVDLIGFSIDSSMSNIGCDVAQSTSGCPTQRLIPTQTAAAAAAQPRIRRLRDDVVEAALGGGAEPPALAFVRLLLHLFANQRCLLDLEWFEDALGRPAPAGSPDVRCTRGEPAGELAPDRFRS